MIPDSPAVASKLHMHLSMQLRGRSLRSRPVRDFVTAVQQDANRSDRPGVRGEQTASAMETKLSDLEQRIDDLLASMDERSRDTKNVEVDSKQGEKTR